MPEPDETGVMEVRGTFQRAVHVAGECEGWLLDGFRTVRLRQGEVARPSDMRAHYRPCQECRPLQFAIWQAEREKGRRLSDKQKREIRAQFEEE